MDPKRLCVFCGAASVIADGSPVFPVGWRCASCGGELSARDGVVLTAPELADTISGFDPEDFAFLAEVELDNFWFVARRRLIAGLIDKFFPTASSFVEIGCGSGNVIGTVARMRPWQRLVGTEIHPAGLVLAKPRMPARVELVQADARRLPFEDAFELGGAFDVLEHIEEDEAALESIYRALSPGGGFLATVPQHPWLWSPADDVAYHQRRYRRGELERKLKRTGFEVVFSTSYTVTLLPLMALARLSAARAKPSEDARQTMRKQFTLAPALNRLLKAVLGLEVGVTLKGVSWPVGGSRVVVARKP
jgi:SAM-dependent methyltransferase